MAACRLTVGSRQTAAPASVTAAAAAVAAAAGTTAGLVEQGDTAARLCSVLTLKLAPPPTLCGSSSLSTGVQSMPANRVSHHPLAATFTVLHFLVQE